MTDIMWEEPLDSSDNDEGLEHLPVALKERPMAWARIATRPTAPKASVLVNRVKGGKGIWSGARYDATQRKMNDEQAVYARYLGPLEVPDERPPAED